MKSLFFFLFSCTAVLVDAQSDIFTPAFYSLQEETGVEIFQPTESDFKAAKVMQQPFQKYQAAIRSRKENLEIRYVLEPFQSDNTLSAAPQVQMMRTVMSAASNEEDAVIAYHNIADAELEFFNADSGKTAFFTPKAGFSSRSFCKLVTLYKEGRGTISVFFLFDDANNPAVEERYFSLRFEE